MALINKDSAINEALRILSGCPDGSGLELMSYKRNRTIALVKLSGQIVNLIEKGYVEEENEITFDCVKKKLKVAIAREFPRSRKIRFHKIDSVEDLKRIHQKI